VKMDGCGLVASEENDRSCRSRASAGSSRHWVKSDRRSPVGAARGSPVWKPAGGPTRRRVMVASTAVGLLPQSRSGTGLGDRRCGRARGGRYQYSTVPCGAVPSRRIRALMSAGFSAGSGNRRCGPRLERRGADEEVLGHRVSVQSEHVNDSRTCEQQLPVGTATPSSRTSKAWYGRSGSATPLYSAQPALRLRLLRLRPARTPIRTLPRPAPGLTKTVHGRGR